MSLTDTSKQKKIVRIFTLPAKRNPGLFVLFGRRTIRFLGVMMSFPIAVCLFLIKVFSFFSMFDSGTGFLFTGFVFRIPPPHYGYCFLSY